MQRNAQRIIIFANGDLPDLTKARLLIRKDDYIISADGGSRHALALAIQPHLIIGDMDSVEPEQLQSFEKLGVPLERFPHDKDETDLELAIRRAVELAPQELVVLGALGGRLDQTLGNLALLSDPQLAACNLKLDDGVEEVFLCRDRAQIQGKRGDLVSLIPWQGKVTDIQTHKLRWALDHDTLYPDKTRGISNEMLEETASLSIGSGLLLIVHRRQSNV